MSRVPTRIEELLRSGRALSDVDTAYVESLLAGTEEKLEDNYQKMYHLTKATQELENEQEGYQSLFAPIRKLPPETLSLIFTYTVSKNKFAKASDSWSNASFLGLVCHHWRSVTLSTPQIWAVVTVHVDFIDDGSPLVLSRLKTHLKRAQSAPLKVELKCFGNRTPYYCPKIENCLISPICERASQWGSLKFDADGNCSHSSFRIFKTFFADKLGALQSLDLGVYLATADKDNENILDLLRESSPNLHAIRLNEYTHLKFLQQTAFPLSQITQLYISTTPEGAVHVFNSCPHLVSVHISVGATSNTLMRRIFLPSSDSDSDPDDNNTSGRKERNKIHKLKTVYILPSLQSLTIQVVNGGGYASDRPFYRVGTILDALDSPSLTSLSLISDATQSQTVYDMEPEYATHRPPSRFITALSDFLTRNQGQHGHKLWAFRTEGIPFRHHMLVSLLKDMPNLRSLTIREASFGGKNQLACNELLKEFTCIPSPSTTHSNLAVDNHDVLSAAETAGLIARSETENISEVSETKYLLSELRDLSLTVYRDWKDNLFEKMVESRVKGTAPAGVMPLEAVSLIVLREPYHLNIRRLRKLQKVGLAIRVTEGEDDPNSPYRTERVILGYKVYHNSDDDEEEE
ncbi:hypothetical protein WG66_006677 [Moniliophthora roreri]|nr:hypothetical protein WG66_006677 [Moniliophthora roreri]